MGIAHVLENTQALCEWDYAFKVVGVSAFAHLFDPWSGHQFIDQLQKECSVDGYLYGVGVDTIFSLLELFQKGQPPRGIILVDIDPGVVLTMKIVVYLLQKCENAASFLLSWSGKGPLSMERLQRVVINQEKNRLVKEQMEVHSQRQLEEWKSNFLFELTSHKKTFSYWLREGYSILHELAKRGDIVPFHADLFNENLLHAISSLPDFKNLNHLIYLSNATDHISRQVTGKFSLDDQNPHLNFPEKSYAKADFVQDLNGKIISKLKILDTHQQNHFIDTTRANDYKLRLHKSIPQFSVLDF